MGKNNWKVKIVFIWITVSILVTTLPTKNIVKTQAAVELKEEEKLLYGYNVTSGKDLTEPDAIQTAFPIIDSKSDYLNHVVKTVGTKQKSIECIASNLSQITESFAKETGADVFGRICVVNADVSSAFDLTRRVDNVYSEKYELYSTSISRYYYIVQLSTEEIRSYLSSQFKADISSVQSKSDALNLFSKYGTHLNTGYEFGGRMNITNYMTTSDATLDLSKGTALKEKVTTVTSKIQVGESASVVEQYGSMENDKTATSTYKFESFGGEATSSLTLDGLFTYNASYVDGNNAGFMYTRWVNSINDGKDLAIIDIPYDAGARSIPLWELLEPSAANYEIRQHLIDAYIEICGNAYNDFIARNPEIVRVSEVIDEAEGGLPTFNGAYVRTKNNFYYYVDKNDFTSSGSHYGIHKGEYLYLDLKMLSNIEGVSYDCQNCDIVDSRSAVFKVTGSSGNVIITVQSDNKKADIIKIPIKSIMCEGGMGNEAYPYIITSEDHISSIPKASAAYYTLYNDIDFGNSSISCLGNFSGVLDGNYCTIKNFKIDTSKEWGLFNKNTGTIKNLKIENAGSSTRYTDFLLGGTYYKEDCVNDNYTKNSIKSVNAGIICATNEGTIDNCYIDGGYIRNIIKNDTSWVVNSTLTMSTGILAGTNSGIIKDCMIKNICVLGAFVNSKENTYGINVFSGGLAGRLTNNCSISSSVVDMGNTSTIMSQIVNPYSKKDANASVQAFAGGIAGYSNASFSMNNSFVYARDAGAMSNYRAIDAEYIFSSKGWLGLSWLFPADYNPKNYHALSSVVLVCGKECNLNSRDNYSHSTDLTLPLTCIMPSNKNGRNAEGNKDTYVEVNSVNEKNINSRANFNTLGLTDTLFSYDSSASSASHINHLLSLNKKNYINLVIDKSNQSVETTIFDNTMFNPKGIELVKVINSENEFAKVFNLIVVDENLKNVTDSKLIAGENNQYKVILSQYKDEIKADRAIELTVSKNEIASVNVINEGDLYHIFYDEKEKYVDSWSGKNVKLQATMTNGEVVLLDDVDDSELSIITTADNIVRGDNLISIKYKHGGKSFDASYVLTVEERKVCSISIATQPTILTYKVGDSIILEGLQVDINYEDGNSIRLAGNDLKQLEVLGNIVSEGKNKVTLFYGGYDNATFFEVQGELLPAETEGIRYEKGNEHRALIIVVAVAAVVVAIGVTLLIVVKKKSKKSR